MMLYSFFFPVETMGDHGSTPIPPNPSLHLLVPDSEEEQTRGEEEEEEDEELIVLDPDHVSTPST